MPKPNPSRQAIHPVTLRFRYGVALAVLGLCVWGAATSVRAGLSRLLSEYGSAAESIEANRRALDFNTADPDVHHAFAQRLQDAGDREAVSEFERAAWLRPRDYFLWQELGRAREESGDGVGAIIALRQAIKLAPFYSQPHWQLGNMLLRRDALDEAFAELRRAVWSDPAHFPVMADLAWHVYEGDTRFVLVATQPQTDVQRLSLARLFFGHNQIEAGLNLVRAANRIDAQDRVALVADLIVAREFQAAHEVWLTGITAGVARNEELFDGGFEGKINSEEQGFGWRPTRATQTLHFSLDANELRSGERSLRIDYAGNFDPAVPALAQLVSVSPGARYRLSFAARTESLLSAGLPLVAVRDAAGDQRVIAEPRVLPSGSNGWHDYSIEFTTAGFARAVTISIQRQPCSLNPCPIVGRAWFDNFSLKHF